MIRFIFGCALVSIGIFVSAVGGSWDISNHLLNKPETFFSIPHAVLYTGVAVAIFGLVIIRIAYRKYISIYANNNSLKISLKLIFIGISMLVVAGPIDFAWHSASGLDGLLSPPHFVLLSGMIVSSVGAMLGIISYVNSGRTVNFVYDRKMNYKKDEYRTKDDKNCYVSTSHLYRSTAYMDDFRRAHRHVYSAIFENTIFQF